MDWTLSDQIVQSDHTTQVSFLSHVTLPNFPLEYITSPGVGLTSSNHYQLLTPIHGKANIFERKKETTTDNKDELKIKVEETQRGFGSEEVIEKQNTILAERDLKRKQLGDTVFNSMSTPKIKTAKVSFIPKSEKKSSNPNLQKGEGKKKVHIFKK